MRIYLDNCCFNRPFDDQSQLTIKLETDAKLFIQYKIFHKQLELVWSYILELENNYNPFAIRSSTISQWRRLSTLCCIENDTIISFAENLYKLGIKQKDALHISCAVYTKCDYFITTDKKLFNKKIQEVKIVNPLTFVIEIEGEK
jgi:predicted nucleic acid-binding protein